MYQDLHLHFERDGDDAWTARLEGIRRTDGDGRPIPLRGTFRPGELLSGGMALLEDWRTSFAGPAGELAARLECLKRRVVGCAKTLGDRLGEEGHLAKELAVYARVSNVRLWVHLDEAPELEVLPWEALVLEFKRVIEHEGWQILRARAPRPARPSAGHLAKTLVLVGDVTQAPNAPEAATGALATVQAVRATLTAKGVACEVAVAATTFASNRQGWRAVGVAYPVVDVAAIGRWIGDHKEANLFVALGHALDERAVLELPEVPALLRGANAFRLGPDGCPRERWTLPVARALEEDARPTLSELLEPTEVRLAVLFGCEANERMAGELVTAVDHVVGMRATIPFGFARVASHVFCEALADSETVGSAVRRMRRRIGELDSTADPSGVYAKLWWTPAHWTGVTEDEPFLDPLAQVIADFRRAQGGYLDQLEGEHAQGRRLSEIAVTLHVDDDAGLVSPDEDVQEEARETWEPRRQARTTSLRDLVVATDASGALARAGAWVVRGEPGSGKTTSVRDLARELCSGALGVTPLYVALAPLARTLPQSTGVVDQTPPLKRLLEERPELRAALEREHERGRLVLLLDGLDEVTVGREALRALLWRLPTSLPRAAIVVTTRPADYNGFRGFHDARLEPLDPAQQEDLLTRWYLARYAADEARRLAQNHLAEIESRGHSLRELARNPLFLNLMGRKLLAGKGLAGGLRHQFLGEMLSFLLEGGHKPESQRRPLWAPGTADVEPGRRILQAIALHMSEEGRLRLGHEELASWLETHAPQKVDPKTAGWSSSKSFLQAVCATSILRPVLRNDPSGEWQFWHRAFQEALTAEALHSEVLGTGGLRPLSSRLNGLLARAGLQLDEKPVDFWREPFALVAGYLGEEASAWVDCLLAHPATRSVGLAAVATADALESAVIGRALAKCETWRESQIVYEHLGARLGQGPRVVPVLHERGLELAMKMRSADLEAGVRFELHFLTECLDVLARPGRSVQGAVEAAEAVLGAIGDPSAVAGLFERVPGHADKSLFVQVPAGKFLMGSPEGEEGRWEDEKQVEVELTRPYWIARVPVTRAQYRLFDPRKYHHWVEKPDLPMTEVTWYEASLFVRWLDHVLRKPLLARLRLPPDDDLCLRLPTEAEWEHACRDAPGLPKQGERYPRYVSGDTEEDLARVAWYVKNSVGSVHPVAQSAPSPKLEVFDMLGNAWEWTSDWYSNELRAGRDPVGPAGGDWRVRRGGSCGLDARVCRAACRGWLGPDFGGDDDGFRVVLAPPLPAR